jgi:hypothetical protein
VYCGGNLPKHHDNYKQPQVEEEKMKARRVVFFSVHQHYHNDEEMTMNIIFNYCCSSIMLAQENTKMKSNKTPSMGS